MVAGAGGIDVVPLVIAADERFMPQTQEHLNILKIINVTRVRFHTGTKEVMARIILQNQEKLLPRDEAFIEVVLKSRWPVCIRINMSSGNYFPITTIGCGKILFINPQRVKIK